MNNDQFRRLILSNSTKGSSSGQNATAQGDTKTGSSALGSRQRASIPMTPRSVSGSNGSSKSLFAKQLAERDQAAQPQKRIRTSAPRGSKLAQGYVDRAKARQDDDEDDIATRLKALEESFRKEEIDGETYDRLRTEIAGGDLSTTHLVKGLDFKLLEKVRKGEDVFERKKKPEPGASEHEPEPSGNVGMDGDVDVDAALEHLEEAELQAVVKEKTQKKGQLSTAPVAAGKKRTRDQILAQLKAAREAAKTKEQSALGTRFKKIGVQKTPGTRIERDGKGREVMIIVDEDGHEKRKVRKLGAEDISTERAAFIPDKNAEVLGMEVPEFYRKKQQEQEEEEENKEVNIFDDADEYDPLAGIASDSGADDSSEDEGSSRAKTDPREEDVKHGPSGEPDAPPPPPPPPPANRNYFKDSKTGLVSEEFRRTTAANDPAVLAALRKAKALNIEAKSEEEKRNAEREQRLKKMLRDTERDADDLDMGFGTNRLEDEEEMEEKGVKLSAWGGDKDGEEGGGGDGGKSKRKRGPKKRKGDVNSAADVLRVLERRKAEES